MLVMNWKWAVQNLGGPLFLLVAGILAAFSIFGSPPLPADHSITESTPDQVAADWALFTRTPAPSSGGEAIAPADPVSVASIPAVAAAPIIAESLEPVPIGTLPIDRSTPAPLDSTPAPDSAVTPGWLQIPSINVDVPVTAAGLDDSGFMEAPPSWYDVAWYRFGPAPGQPGSAVLAGHLDTDTGAPAAFWNLNKLQPGDPITYLASDGSPVTFVVYQITAVSWDQLPLDEIFARRGEARITLITCGGSWSREHRNYSHRTLVYARLVNPAAGQDGAYTTSGTGSAP